MYRDKDMKPAIMILNRTPKLALRKQRIPVFTMVLAASIAAAMPAQADYEKGVQAWESGQYQEALTEWMSAANADDGQAMLAIGRAYLQGLGVLQDYVEAHKWLNLAASRGVQEALKERDALSAEMTEDERAEAQALARQWRPDGGATAPSASASDTGTAPAGSPEPPPEAIREAQALLKALGYRPGPADGLWGRRTGAAYKSFLQDKGKPASETLSLAALLAMRDIAKAQGIDLTGDTSAGGVQQQGIDATSSRAALAPNVLHQAAKAGDVATLKAALDAGANVNELDGQGWTALMHAVNKGNVLIVESLVEVGADVDVQAPDGATALFMAAVLGQPKFIELLVKANADVSIQGPKGMTAVDVARLTLGESDTVRERGMDSAVVGLIEGRTWKETLANETTREFVDLLGRYPSAETVNEYGWTDLHWAAVMNSPKLAGLLLDTGANVDRRLTAKPFGDELNAQLGRAADACWMFLIRGNETPLHLAAGCGAIQVAELFIARGADVEARDARGRTPLHYVAVKDALGVAELLIAHGADVDAGASNGHTPLMLAVGANAMETAELLIAHGADVNASENLIGSTSLHSAATANELETAEFLIARGADVEARAALGRTPLMSAVGAKAMETAELLIAYGADVDARDAHGRTPLHHAVESNAMETAELLIAHGADFDVRDISGKTPLNLAKYERHFEMAKLLQQHSGE